MVRQTCVSFLPEQSHLWGATREKKECLLSWFTASMKKGRVGRQKDAYRHIPHFYVGGKEDIHGSLCPHAYLMLYHPTFPLSPTSRETLQGWCKNRSGAFSNLPTHSTKKGVSRQPYPAKLFFCHSQNAPPLSELRLRPNICKTCTRQPRCQPPHGLLPQCSHSVLLSQQQERGRRLYLSVYLAIIIMKNLE